MDPMIKINKIRSLLVLSTFTSREDFDIISNYLLFLIQKYNKSVSVLDPNFDFSVIEDRITVVPFIPDYEWCVGFWLGYEAQCVPPHCQTDIKISLQKLITVTLKESKIASFKYHGNYCGPNWTDNKYKPAKDGTFSLKSIDKLDEACKQHDIQYKNQNYLEADKKFLEQISELSDFKSQLAYYPIYIQKFLRELGIMTKNGKKSTKKNNGNPIKGIKRTKKNVAVIKAIKNIAKRRTVNRGPPVAIRSIQKRTRGNIKIGNKSLNGKNLRVTGSVFAGYVSSGSGATPGKSLFEQAMNPTMMTGRLPVIAGLYEKYKFLPGTRMEFVPQVGSDTPGSFVSYFDFDPYDVDPTGLPNVTKAMDANKSITCKVWENAHFPFHYAGSKTDFFYTTPGLDDRFDVQASFKAIANSNIPASQTLGSFMLHYNILFSGSEIQPSDSNLFSEYSYTNTSKLINSGDIFNFPQIGGKDSLISNPKIEIRELNDTDYDTYFYGTLPLPGFYLMTIHSSIYQYGANNGVDIGIDAQTGQTIVSADYYQGNNSGGDITFPGTGAVTLMFESQVPNSNIPENIFTNMGPFNTSGNSNLHFKVKIQRVADSYGDYQMSLLTQAEKFEFMKKYKIRHGKNNLLEQKINKLDELIQKVEKLSIEKKEKPKPITQTNVQNLNQTTKSDEEKAKLRELALAYLAKGNKDN